jgi:hypothetical protein
MNEEMQTWEELTATLVGTKSVLLMTNTRCLCGASSRRYFSTLLHRVPSGSLASRTCRMTSVSVSKVPQLS